MRTAQRFAGIACLTLLTAAALGTAPGCGDYDDGYERDRRGDYYYEDDRGGGGSYYRDRGRYEDDYDRRRYRDDDDRDYYRDRDRDRDRDDNDNDGDRIPRDANLVANGNDALTYTAASSGRVYVRDEKSGKVIYAGRVQGGQKLTIDPGRRGVAVDGRTVKGELDKKPREREVFFRPDRGSQPRSTPEPRKKLTPLPGKASSGGGEKSDADRVVP